MYRKFLALVVCCAVMVGVAQAGSIRTSVTLNGTSGNSSGDGRLDGNQIYIHNGTSFQIRPSISDPVYSWSASGNTLLVASNANSITNHTITGSGNTVDVRGGSISGNTLNIGNTGYIYIRGTGTSELTNITAGGGNNIVTIEGNGTLADNAGITVNGGQNTITVDGSGEVEADATITAGGIKNTVNLKNGTMSGDIKLGDVSLANTEAEQSIVIENGTNSGIIEAYGDKNSLEIKSGTNNGTEIKFKGSSNEITVRDGTNTGDVTADGGSNKVLIEKGTNSGNFGFGAGGNEITIESGTNSGNFTAAGGSNVVLVKDGTNSGDMDFSAGNNSVTFEKGTNSGDIKATGDINTYKVSDGTNTHNVFFDGDYSTVLITGGTYEKTIADEKITLGGDHNTIEITTTGTMDGYIVAEGGHNGLLISDTAKMSGNITLGTIANPLDDEINTITMTGGTTSGKITSQGDDTEIDISNKGVLTGEIIAEGGGNKLNISGNTNDVKVSGIIKLGDTQGKINTVEIAGGTTSAEITVDGDGNEFTIKGSDTIVTSNKIHFTGRNNNILIDDNHENTGDLTIVGGENVITIKGGDNSGTIKAEGNKNELTFSGGETSTDITLGKEDTTHLGGNTITVTEYAKIDGGTITAKGTTNKYRQDNGVVDDNVIFDLGDEANGKRDTRVYINDDAEMNGLIKAYDGRIKVEGTDAKIAGDITADYADADTTWILKGGNFTEDSHLVSVAGDGFTNTFIIKNDANFKNVDVNDDTEAAIETSGAGKTIMTIKEMYESNTSAISGRIILGTDYNELNLLGGAHIAQTGILDIRGEKENSIKFDLEDDNDGDWVGGATYIFRNLLDLTNAKTHGAVNTVTITSGILDRGDRNESILGSTGTTTYIVEGGVTRYINTNTGTGKYEFTDGIVNPDRKVGVTNPIKDELDAQVFNIRNGSVASETLGTSGTTVKFESGDYLVYTILNVGETPSSTPNGKPTGGTVTIQDGATVTLGIIDYGDNDITDPNRYKFEAQSVLTAGGINGGFDYSAYALSDGTNPYEAQITASNVMVDAGGTLVIHENARNWKNDSVLGGTHNIIDNLTIQGHIDFTTEVITESHATLDRTSIHGSSSDAKVNVGMYGYLHGFGYYKKLEEPSDHTPMRENVEGDIVLGAGIVSGDNGWVYRGGTLQPYNADLFKMAAGEKDENVVKKLMGVVFEASGDIEFKNSSFLSTRLFHQNDTDDSSKINIDGGLNQLHYSDSVVSDSFTFSDVWDPLSSKDIPLSTSLDSKIHQGKKVQYDPVFGFNYELKSKLAFKLYQGLPGSNEQTYYYQVASADKVIDALYMDKGNNQLELMPDANHLFNRSILKSDMLGEWTFLYTGTEKDIVLRFRLLADHPQNGGFVVDETERNNILVGKYLDEIRYPYLTDSSFLNLPGDYAGDISGLTEDPTMNVRNPDGTVDPKEQEYGGKGFSGNLADHYRDWAKEHEDDPTVSFPATNYKDAWMRDWEDLFMGIQLDIQSGSDMRRGLRSLHAESYANVASSNFTVLSQFIRNRERNAISALYQVEADLHKKAEDDGVIMKDGMEWHVPIIEQDELPFVENPIRFWASGFGQSGYVRNSGTEYGYDLESWGGAVGVIKEFRNFYGGLTIGYADTKSTWDNLPSAGKTKSYMAEALVGMHFWDRYFVEGYFDYAYGEQTMNRSVDFGAGYYTGEATGDFVDHTYAGGLRLGFQSVLLDKYVFVATVGAQVMSYTNNGFTERGRETMASLLKIKKGSMDRTIFKTPVTVRLGRPFALGGWVMTPEVRASFSPYFGDREGILEGAEWRGNPFPGRTFNSYGTKHGKYEAEVGATIELSRRGRFYLAGNYDMTYTKNSIMHNYSLQAGLNF